MSTPPAENTKKCDMLYCICCSRIIPQRHVMIAILCFSSMLCYIHRVCLNMAIVNMTKYSEDDTHQIICPRYITEGNGTEISYTRVLEEINDQQFDWDEEIQAYILLSFFVGYMISNFCIGFIIQYFGCRWSLFTGIVMTSVATLVIPPLAYYTHWAFVCVARIVAGLGQAAQYSTSAMFISRWILEDKKSSTTTILLTTFSLGLIVGYVCTGYIMEWTKTWCWVFYIFGCVGLIIAVVFYFYVYSYPEIHPHITPQEYSLLENIPKPAKKKMPVWRILSDLAAWMFLLGYFASDYSSYIILTNMPKYFVQVLGFTPGATGIVLMGPAFAALLGGLLFGLMADWLIGKYIRKLYYRMLCTVIGIPLSAVCLLLMVYVRCDSVMAAILLCLSMFLKSAFFAGAGMMVVDITMNYGGLLFGFGNVFGGLSGIIAPYVIGHIAYQNKFAQWEIVQYITLVISVVCCVVILMFSKAGRKEWDYGDDETPPPADDTPAAKRIWSCYKPE